jgi:lactoylglutathione lyase
MSEDRLFKKVGAVILLVSDMEKSVKFYRDVLRLPIKSQSEEWTEFFNAGTVIALHPRRKAKVNPRIAVLVGFMVTDLDDVVNKLKQQGVKFFKEPKEEPFGKHTILEDPDGHLISIAQIESKSAEGFDLLGFLIDMGVDIQD